jgi:hypothetical protein
LVRQRARQPGELIALEHTFALRHGQLVNQHGGDRHYDAGPVDVR